MSKTTVSTSEETQNKTPHPGPPKTVWREYFESAVVTFVMFLFFITFVGRTVAVPTSSMENTIMVGDHFLINKFIYGMGSHPPFLPQRDVKRGDVVVFKYPGDRYHRGSDESRGIIQYETYYIKRVIGLPGDTIEVKGPHIFINGNELPERRVEARQDCDKCPVTVTGTETGQGPYLVYYSARTLAAGEDTSALDTDYYRFGVGKPYKIPAGHY